MSSVLKEMPTSIRMAVVGLEWGAAIGAGAGAAYVASVNTVELIRLGIGAWDGPIELVVGVAMFAVMAACVGGFVGGALGLISGIAAGLVLMTFQSRCGSTNAAAATVGTVAGLQILLASWLIGSLVTDPRWLWLSLVTPLVGLVPMFLAARAAARDWAVGHRSGLAVESA